jgi:hypothetical protein
MEVNFSRIKEKTEHEKALENIRIHTKKKKMTNIFIKYFKNIDQKHLYFIKWKLITKDPLDIKSYYSNDNYNSTKTYSTNDSELVFDTKPPDTYQMSSTSKTSNQNVIKLFQKIIKKNESPNLKLIYFIKWKSMIIGTRTRTFSVKQKKIIRKSVKFVRPSLHSKQKEQNKDEQKEEEEEKIKEIKDLYNTDDSVKNYESLGALSNLEEEKNIKDIKQEIVVLLRKIIQRKILLNEGQNGVLIFYFRKWKILCLKQKKESIFVKAKEKEKEEVKDEIKGDDQNLNEEEEDNEVYNNLFCILKREDEVTRKKSRKKLLDIINTFDNDKGNEEEKKTEENYNDNIINLDDNQNEIKSSLNSDANQSIKIKAKTLYKLRVIFERLDLKAKYFKI